MPFRPRETIITSAGNAGRQRVLTPDMCLDDDDPTVKALPHLFDHTSDGATAAADGVIAKKGARTGRRKAKAAPAKATPAAAEPAPTADSEPAGGGEADGES